MYAYLQRGIKRYVGRSRSIFFMFRFGGVEHLVEVLRTEELHPGAVPQHRLAERFE